MAFTLAFTVFSRLKMQSSIIAFLAICSLFAEPSFARERNRSAETGVYSVLDIDETNIAPDVYYEMYLLVPETIRYRGYECEEHQVTTDDGYVLTLHRVLPGASNRSEPTDGAARPAVFLQHGLLDSSFTWVNNLVHQSLAFILVDNGFDVWLGNSRGNKYSRKHQTLNPDTDPDFWRWDYDQLSTYDVAASVAYVSRTTGQQKISWVGHSQGCMIALAGFLNQSVAEKINVFVALAPAARVANIESELLRKLAPYANVLNKALHTVGWSGEFLPNDNFYTWLGGSVCSNLPVICEEFIEIIAGYDSPDMNETRIPVYFTHFPAGSSGRNVVHYAQNLLEGKFQYFDYGLLENMKKYHSRRPPAYDLKKMNVSTAVIWGSKDKLADATDVKWLMDELPNLVLQKEIQEFGHADFVWGEHANTLVYPTVVSLINQFSRS